MGMASEIGKHVSISRRASSDTCHVQDSETSFVYMLTIFSSSPCFDLSFCYRSLYIYICVILMSTCIPVVAFLSCFLESEPV